MMDGLRNHYQATKVENFDMTKGDTFAFGIKISFDEEPQQLEKAYFGVKKALYTEELVVLKSLGNGIDFVEQEGNDLYYTVRMAPTDTSELPDGEYYYALTVEMNGEKYTLLSGMLRMRWDATENAETWRIVMNPQSQVMILNVDADVYFVCGVNDSRAQYQWEGSINGGQTWANVSAGTGATTPAYKTGVSAHRNGDLYRCKVTFRDGSSAYSEVAKLTVRDSEERDH